MATVLFSIVIPLYNRAASIGATIRSVTEQTHGNFEIIIVDDGSSDNPEPVIAALNDPRIRYCRQENAGGGSARNRGIMEAKGKFIAFLDSDDFFLPHKLATVASFLDDDPNHVWYSYVNVDRGVGRFWARPSRAIRPDEDVGAYMFIHNEMIQTSAIVLPRELALRVLFDPTLRKGQDLDFCLRLQRAGAYFTMIEEPLVIWVDVAETGRTSHLPGYAPVLAWLDRCGHMLSGPALMGYRATVLAYYMARARPLTVARDLAYGLFRAGVPPRIIARQAMRAYLPRKFYRHMVNSVVWLGGNK